MCVCGFFADDAVENKGQYWVIGKVLHLSICLAGRHFVYRAKRHVRGCEAAAKQIRDRGQQKRVGMLSGGERGRLHLAKTLIAGGNVLMLDEPSNDLDVETLRSLEDALLEFAGSVMVISHDRWFLDRIATHILAAEGDSQWTFFNGNYQEYEADKKKRLGEEGAKPKRMRYKALK